jgi:hypothetical protein
LNKEKGKIKTPFAFNRLVKPEASVVTTQREAIEHGYHLWRMKLTTVLHSAPPPPPPHLSRDLRALACNSLYLHTLVLDLVEPGPIDHFISFGVDVIELCDYN